MQLCIWKHHIDCWKNLFKSFWIKDRKETIEGVMAWNSLQPLQTLFEDIWPLNEAYSKFKWAPESEEAFEELKLRLTTAPVLTIIDNSFSSIGKAVTLLDCFPYLFLYLSKKGLKVRVSVGLG